MYNNYLHCCLSTIPGIYHCDETGASLCFKNYNNIFRVLGAKWFESYLFEKSHEYCKTFFALFEWPTYVFSTRKVLLFIKSVQNNAALNIRITGVISVPMLRKLIRTIQKYANAKLYTALFLAAFFGFFRLASLLLVSLIKLGIIFRMI